MNFARLGAILMGMAMLGPGTRAQQGPATTSAQTAAIANQAAVLAEQAQPYPDTPEGLQALLHVAQRPTGAGGHNHLDHLQPLASVNSSGDTKVCRKRESPIL